MKDLYTLSNPKAYTNTEAPDKAHINPYRLTEIETLNPKPIETLKPLKRPKAKTKTKKKERERESALHALKAEPKAAKSGLL